MKKKFIFILALLATFSAILATTVHQTYALETATNELDIANVTAVNDTAGALMGVRITDSSFASKNLLVGLDLPEFMNQNNVQTGYFSNSLKSLKKYVSDINCPKINSIDLYSPLEFIPLIKR